MGGAIVAGFVIAGLLLFAAYYAGIQVGRSQSNKKREEN